MKPDILTQILGFLSAIASFLGMGIVRLVQYVLPAVPNLDNLIEPLGFLALLTVFVILASAARKTALIVVVAGWVLILVRVLLMAFRLA